MLLIRADANAVMGTGHMMRCLALAQAWRDQIGPVQFACAEIPKPLANRLRSESFDVATIDATPGSSDDARQLIQLLELDQAQRVVIDGYQFGNSYQSELAKHPSRTLFFDDYGHCSRYEADWILNQNLGADPALYENRSEHTRLLIGSEYILLRQEFLGHADATKDLHQPVKNILVTLGGSDPQNLTLPVLLALQPLVQSTMSVQVILGAGYRHRESLQNLSKEFPCPIEIVENVSNMAPVFQWTDVAVCAGGSTNWEMAYFGIPRIVLIQADNQMPACQSLKAAGCIQLLDARNALDELDLKKELHLLTTSPSRLQQMSHANRGIVDGRGIHRVLAEIAPEGTRAKPAGATTS